MNRPAADQARFALERETLRHEGWCPHETARLADAYFSASWPAPIWPRTLCTACEQEAHRAWVAQVAAKLRAGLRAAAEGRTVRWNEPPEPGHYAFWRMSTGVCTWNLEYWYACPETGGEL